MIDKLLHAVKLEKYEPELAHCLAGFNNVGCREMVIAHISNTPKTLRHIPTLLKEGVARHVAARAQEKLDEMASAARAHGVSVRTLVQNADIAWLSLRELAEREKPSLIVVGPLVGTELGHTVYFLMHGMDTPLLIVKLPEEIAQESSGISCRSIFRRILYPTDWSKPALKAQDFIYRLRPMGAEEVIVVHAVDPVVLRELTPERQEEYRTQVQQQLESAKRAFDDAGFSAKTITGEGSAAEQINTIAKRENATLIVMGSTGKSVSEEMRLGSVSERVARDTDRSLLLVNPDALSEDRDDADPLSENCHC